MNKQESSNAVGAVFVSLLLLGIYVGSYFLLVEGGSISVYTYQAERLTYWPPKYRIGGKFSEAVFLPIHRVDRQARPKTWEIVKPMVVD